MKNFKRHSLKETSYRFLFEQEEEAEEDTAEDEVFGGDEAEETDEGGDEGGGGGGEDTAGEETESDEEEEEIAVSPEDQYRLSDSVDQELDALFIDFEEEARKSSVVNQDDDLIESFHRKLFESVAEDIDLRSFASNLARLVRNYQNLIDWEAVILNKAESFINNHYGEDTAAVLFDILGEEYGIEREAKQDEPLEEPIAVGARGESGG
jgi:hypothetical protein